MTNQLTQEIQTRNREIRDLEKRLEALQTAQPAPVADEFDSATDFMQATRDYHQSERDRLDEVAATEAVLPPSRAKLKDLQDRFDGIKSPVEQHFEELVSAALEANKVFEQAEAVYENVLAMAKHQTNLGHQIVNGSLPLSILQSPLLPIFVVGGRTMSLMPRGQYRDYKANGNLGEGTRV